MLKAKVETLELALGKIVKSVTKFQNFAIESGGLPPNVALELSRTALEIMNHASEARTVKSNQREQGNIAEGTNSTGDTSGESIGNQEQNGGIGDPVEHYVLMQASAMSKEALSAQPDSNISTISKRSRPPTSWQADNSISPQPSTTLFPWTSNHRNLTFAQRLRLACVERGFQLLSTPNISFPEIHPALSLHLKWMTIHELRTLTEQSLRGVGQLNAYGPIQAPILIHPEMYRTIEGVENVLVNRAPSKDMERLVFGRTRTIVETALPGFEGEWLEPIDVQEYLEDKGIQVESPQLPLTIPETGLSDSELDSFPSIGSFPELATSYPAVASLPGTKEDLLGEQAPSNWIYTNTVSSQLPTTNEGKTLTYFNHTLNLQNLIEYLAMSAICIGPGPGMRRDDVDKALEHCIVGF